MLERLQSPDWQKPGVRSSSQCVLGQAHLCEDAPRLQTQCSEYSPHILERVKAAVSARRADVPKACLLGLGAKEEMPLTLRSGRPFFSPKTPQRAGVEAHAPPTIALHAERDQRCKIQVVPTCGCGGGSAPV